MLEAMRKRSIPIWALFLFPLSLFTISDPASWGNELDIWVIGESYKVDPVSGSVFGVFETNPKSLKIENEIWNSNKRHVWLQVSKNEVLAFQIILERKNRPVENIDILLGDISGPETDKNPILNLFLEGYTHIEMSDLSYTRWIPDLLIPFEVKVGDIHSKLKFI